MGLPYAMSSFLTATKDKVLIKDTIEKLLKLSYSEEVIPLSIMVGTPLRACPEHP